MLPAEYDNTGKVVFITGAGRGIGKGIAQTIPLGRPGELREVGLLALYLASAASNYMTGRMIFLAEGMSL